MFDGEEPVTDFTIPLSFPDPSNPGQDSWKARVIILNHHANFKFQLGQDFKNSNEDIELLKTYFVY